MTQSAATGEISREIAREIIREVLNGNTDAYRVLMERHFVAVHRIAFRITGNEADAEEVTQEAFVRAYNKLATFREDAAFSTWVTRIAMNMAINFLSRRKHDVLHGGTRITEENSAVEQTMQVADTQAGPERSLLSREAAVLREEAMRELTAMERTAFTLRHMEDISITEIALALKVRAGTAGEDGSSISSSRDGGWEAVYGGDDVEVTFQIF